MEFIHSFIHKGLFRIVITVKTLNCNNFPLKIHIQSNYIIKQIFKSVKLPTIYQRTIALKLNTLTKNTPTSNHQPYHTHTHTHTPTCKSCELGISVHDYPNGDI